MGIAVAQQEVESSVTHDKPHAVLIVEDDPDSRELLTELLAAELPEAEVTSVATAEEALKFLHGRHVDAVVTDHTLPGMSGVELAIRLSERNPRPGLVLVSGHSTVEGSERFDAMIGKPLDVAELASTLRRLFERGQAAQGAPAPG